MSIRKKLTQRFLSRLPENKVFIIPTVEGIIFSLSTFSIILIGIVFSNNSILLIGFTLLIVIIFHAFSTNNNLENLKVDNCENYIYGPVSKLMSSFVGNLKTKKNIDFQIFMKSGERISQKYNALSDVLGVDFTELNRGVYEVQRLRLSSTYPFSLFYAWKVFRPDNKSVYVFPKIQGMSFEKPKKQVIFLESDQSKLSSDQKYKEHKRYESGDNLSKVDWRRFAKDRRLYTKNFESNESEELSFIAHQAMTEEEISQMSYWIKDVYERELVWNYKSNRLKLKKLKTRKDLEKCLKDLTLL